MKSHRHLLVLVVELVCLLGFLGTEIPTAWAQGIPDRRFGVIETYHAPGAATETGAGWTRVTFEWNQIQPNGPEEWIEYPIPDAAIAREVAAGREVIGLIITTPGWATAQFGGKNVPAGLHLPVDDPHNLWAHFVRTLISRHQGRIQHWIIWNEPDIWGTDFQSWGGSVEEFARILEIAYRIAHELDPAAVIHLPAMTHWWDANYGRELYLRRLLDVITTLPEAAENHYFFDAFTLHLYFNADTIFDLSQYYYGILNTYGLSAPLWLVETNAPPSDDPTWPIRGPNFQITQEDQAAFIVQGFAMALAAGAQRIGFYKMADLESDHVNPEPFGLVRLDGSYRPALEAYRTATYYLAGFRQASLTRRDDATVVTVRRSNGWTTVAWARGVEAIDVTIPAHSDAARLVDWQGAVRWIHAQGGVFSLTLPGSACTHPANPCLIGGAPFMIVEGGISAGYAAPPAPPAPPAATQAPEHEPIVTATLTLIPSPSPTRQATASPQPSPTPTRTPTPSPTAATRPTRTAAAAPAPLPTSTVTPTVSPAPIAAATAAPAASATAATQISRVRQQPYLPGLPWVVVGLILTGVVIAGWAHVSGYTRGRNNDG